MYPPSQLNLAGEVNPIEPELASLVITNARDYGAMGDGVHNDAFAINAAILAASVSGGGIVGLDPGTYLVGAIIALRANVRLAGLGARGSVTLRATSGLNIAIVANYLESGIGPTGSSTVRDNNVTVKNIIFDLNGSNQTAQTCPTFQWTRHLLLEDCQVINPWAAALLVTGGNVGTQGYYSHDRPVVRGCIFDGTGQVSGGDLVDFGDCVDGLFAFCEVRSSRSGSTGLSVAQYSGVQVVGCVLANNGGQGVVLEGGDAARVTGCHIYGNATAGIHVFPWEENTPTLGSTNTLIANNDIHDNLQGLQLMVSVSAQTLTPSGITVTGNAIYHNTQSAMYIEWLTDLVVTGNVIKDNSQGGVGAFYAVHYVPFGSATKNLRHIFSGNDFVDDQGTPTQTAIFSLAQFDQIEITGNILSGAPATGFIAIGTGPNGLFAASRNRGYNPLAGAITTPAVPASGTALQNTTGVDVYFLTWTGTVSAVAVSDIAGLNYQYQGSSGTQSSGILPAGASIKITYSVTPSWAWYGL